MIASADHDAPAKLVDVLPEALLANNVELRRRYVVEDDHGGSEVRAGIRGQCLGSEPFPVLSRTARSNPPPLSRRRWKRNRAQRVVFGPEVARGELSGNARRSGADSPLEDVRARRRDGETRIVCANECQRAFGPGIPKRCNGSIPANFQPGDCAIERPLEGRIDHGIRRRCRIRQSKSPVAQEQHRIRIRRRQHRFFTRHIRQRWSVQIRVHDPVGEKRQMILRTPDQLGDARVEPIPFAVIRRSRARRQIHENVHDSRVRTIPAWLPRGQSKRDCSEKEEPARRGRKIDAAHCAIQNAAMQSNAPATVIHGD